MTRTIFSGVKAKAFGAELTGTKSSRDFDGHRRFWAEHLHREMGRLPVEEEGVYRDSGYPVRRSMRTLQTEIIQKRGQE